MSKRNGFGAVEGLLVVVILAVVGFGGYYVFNNQNDNDSPQNSNNSISQTQDSTSDVDQESPRADTWKLVTSGQNGFELRVPDGWSALNIQDSDWLYIPNADGTNHNEGSPAEIENLESFGTDGRSRFSIVHFDNTDDFAYLTGEEENKGSIKADSVDGTIYYESPLEPEEVGEGIGPAVGVEYYTFEFKTDTTTTYVNYSRQTGYTETKQNKEGDTVTESVEAEEDILEIVKEMIATLKIN